MPTEDNSPEALDERVLATIRSLNRAKTPARSAAIMSALGIPAEANRSLDRSLQRLKRAARVRFTREGWHT